MAYNEKDKTTKILIVDNDETSFQVRKCIAKVLAALPPVELFHARDASEALALLEQLKPDVVMMDHENEAEKDLFFDSLTMNHPPVMVCTDGENTKKEKFSVDNPITYVKKSESLDDIHQSLMMATTLGAKSTSGKDSKAVH